MCRPSSISTRTVCKTAHENAEKNHVEIGRGLCGDALRDPKLAEDIGGGYDVIVANIVADVIIGMSPMFADKLVKGGTLICSGILNERARGGAHGAGKERIYDSFAREER